MAVHGNNQRQAAFRRRWIVRWRKNLEHLAGIVVGGVIAAQAAGIPFKGVAADADFGVGALPRRDIGCIGTGGVEPVIDPHAQGREQALRRFSGAAQVTINPLHQDSQFGTRLRQRLFVVVFDQRRVCRQLIKPGQFVRQRDRGAKQQDETTMHLIM